MTGDLFDAETRAKLLGDLKRATGSEKSGTVQYARALIVTALDLIAGILESRGSPGCVFLENDAEKQIIGWGMFDGRITTEILALSASTNVIRLNTTPYFIGHDEGVTVWMDAMLSVTQKNVRVTR
jgi:hypothetical protein